MLHAIERKSIDDDRIHGVIVSESDSLLLVQYEYDFEFDGFIVVRRRDVSKSYSSDSNDYCEGLMRSERLWKLPSKSIRSLPLNDWKTVLTSLIGKYAIIENERRGDFFIGPIIACDDRAVTLHHFDGCGEWQELERIPYRFITSVKFGNRYIEVHRRHLPPRPSKFVGSHSRSKKF